MDNGQYRWLGFQRERLCPDYCRCQTTTCVMTIHAIQHCVNVARGTLQILPSLMTDELYLY